LSLSIDVGVDSKLKGKVPVLIVSAVILVSAEENENVRCPISKSSPRTNREKGAERKKS
jgi:hypothetical protein